MTLTEDSVTVCWTSLAPGPDGGPVPAPTAGELRIGPADSPRSPAVVWAAPEPTPFHQAEIRGLEPGRRYRFEAWSAHARAAPGLSVTRAPGSPETTGEFITPVPPPGRLLHTLALAADVHLGETVSGLITGGFPPGFEQEPGLPPYPEVMLDAVLADARDRGTDQLLIAGDLTAEATPEQTRAVAAALGRYPGRTLVTRGNHDRPHTGDEYAGCAAVTADHRDCWGETFVPRQQLVTAELGGLRIIGLDTSGLDGAGGRLEDEQFARLTELLRAEPERPTLVLGHHPVTGESGRTALGGPGFVLNAADAYRLQQAYAAAPGVFLHYAGHTHRNLRTRPDLPIPVEFLEVAAVKEYPGGYARLRVYEGGYSVNFVAPGEANAWRWRAITRGEYFGAFPAYALGSLADRNHTEARDLTGAG